MKSRFGYANTRMMERYIRKDDPHEHFVRQNKAWGEEPQPEWVHIFWQTLDTIRMYWYLENKLWHWMDEWDILKEIFVLKFIFKYYFECIDEALKEIKAATFKIPE